MTMDAVPPADDAKPPRRRRRWQLALAGGLGVLTLSSTVAVAMSGADKAHVEAGVYIAGTLVAGKDEAALHGEIKTIEERVAHAPLSLTLAGRTCAFDPIVASVSVDADATARAALDAGMRPRGFVDKARTLAGRRVDVPLAVAFDDQAIADAMNDCEKRLLDDLPVEGAIVFDGVTAKAVPPRAGHRVRRDALRAAITNAVASGSAMPIELPIEAAAPTLTDGDVKTALDVATSLTKESISLRRDPTAEEMDEARRAAAVRDRQIAEMKAMAPKTRKTHKKKKGDQDAPPPKIPPPIAMPKTIELTMTQAELAAATRATLLADPPRLDVHFDPVEIGRKLTDVSTDLADSARDASFDIDDKDHVTVVPSRTGTRVDPEKVAVALKDAASKPDRTGELPVDHGADPALTTADAEKLGIKGLVASFTTHHPCCQPRVVNIHRIADLMDGVIVKPGETFSVNKFVGPRTVERGFVVAPSIGDGEMVDTVGGGISQFATTLFNALFDGGYAIKERKAHSFWFNRYPMGIEATLSDPSPDLVFENDTDAGILIKAKYDKTSITVPSLRRQRRAEDRAARLRADRRHRAEDRIRSERSPRSRRGEGRRQRHRRLERLGDARDHHAERRTARREAEGHLQPEAAHRPRPFVQDPERRARLHGARVPEEEGRRRRHDVELGRDLELVERRLRPRQERPEHRALSGVSVERPL